MRKGELATAPGPGVQHYFSYSRDLKLISRCNLKMACEVGSVGAVVFSLVSECLNKEPQTRGCHLCLTAHHQLTQSIVDEVILRLEEEGRGGEGGKDSERTHQAQ